MKKTLKVLSIVFLTIAMLFTFAQPVSLADRNAGTIVDGIDQTADSKTMDTGINDVAGTVVNWIWGISIIIAIVVLMIIGVKFIIGGTQEKAEYKKSLLPVVVGVVLVVFATTIVKFLFSMK